MASITTPPNDDLLLRIFKDHVRSQIKDMIQPEVDKVIDEAVNKAVESLEVKLVQQLDHYHRDHMIKIILEKR